MPKSHSKSLKSIKCLCCYDYVNVVPNAPINILGLHFLSQTVFCFFPGVSNCLYFSRVLPDFISFLSFYKFLSKVQNGFTLFPQIPPSWKPSVFLLQFGLIALQASGTTVILDIPSLLFWVGPNLSWTSYFPLS